MQSQATAVSFSTSGATLTEHLRGLVLSKRWRAAFSDAKEIFVSDDDDQPFPDELAWGILKGEYRVEGNSRDGIEFVTDDDAEAYLGQLDEIYGGTVEIDGILFRPYAVVTDYGVTDRMSGSMDKRLEVIRESFHDKFVEIGDEIARRARHYRSRDSDRIVPCAVPSRLHEGKIRRMAVLFELAPELPLWMPPHRTPQKAVEAVIDRLSYTGHEHRYVSSNPEQSERIRRDFEEGQIAMKLGRGRAIRQSVDFNMALIRQQDDEARLHREMLDKRTAEIISQNETLGFGMRKYDFGPDLGVREVPAAPLIHWAVNRLRMDDSGFVPDWQAISPVGVKQVNDDPVHTDWVTAAGLLDANIDIRQDEIAHEIQRELLGFQVHVLAAGRDTAQGYVRFCKPDTVVDGSTIAVVPNASVRYYEIALKAAAVIVVEGGAMSHLAVNGLDQGMLIVRDPDAKKKYREGMFLTIDGRRGHVEAPARAPDEDDDLDGGGFKP